RKKGKPMHKSLKNSEAKQTGMTFIEVLIALVIMVTGILGAVAMQATAKKGSFDALQRSLASALTQDILERMRSSAARVAPSSIRAEIPGVLNNYVGTYGGAALTAPNPACDAIAAICTPAELVSYDLYQWTQSLRGANVTSGAQSAGGLLNARGCITEVNRVVTVTISWEGRESTQDGGAASANFDTNTACGAANDKRRQIHIQAIIY
ncbi:MAG: type IV pilus modification protein PilV, partial [Colwellia sp.]